MRFWRHHARRPIRPRQPRGRAHGDGESRDPTWDVDAFLALDEERRSLIGEVEALQAQRNEASKAIGALMKDGKRDEAEAAKEQVRAVNERIAGLEAHLDAVEADTRDLLMTAPNIPRRVGAGRRRARPTTSRSAAGARRPTFDFEPQGALGPRSRARHHRLRARA